MKHATSYKVKSVDFNIDNIMCGEWTTKNNEMFVPNPESYFDIFMNKDQYIGFGNLMPLTSVPNNKFTIIQPMIPKEAELCKYKYTYACPVQVVNQIENTGGIEGESKSPTVNMID